MSTKRKNNDGRPRTAVVFNTLEPKQGRPVAGKRQKTRSAKSTQEVELADWEGSSRVEANVPMAGPSGFSGVFKTPEVMPTDIPILPKQEEDDFVPPIAEATGTSTVSPPFPKA